jgi:hypothetical protein
LHRPLETLENPPRCTPFLVESFSMVPRLQWGLWCGRSQMTNKRKQTNKFLLSLSISFLPFLSISVSSIALWKVVAGMGFGISFFLLFFCNEFFQSHFSTCEFSLVVGIWNIFLYFFFLLFWMKNSQSLFISNLSFNLNSLPSFFFCFIHYTGDWKVPRMGLFFLCFVSVCVLWVNTSPKFDNRHHAWSSFVFSFNFLFVLWQTQAPNFITIPGSGSLQFLLNQQASQLVWWEGKEGFIPEEYKYCLQLFFYWGEFKQCGYQKTQKKGEKILLIQIFFQKNWTF